MGAFGLSAGVLDAAVALLWVVSGLAAESPLLLQPGASSSSDEERTNGAAYRFMRSVANTCASRWDVGSSRPEASAARTSCAWAVGRGEWHTKATRLTFAVRDGLFVFSAPNAAAPVAGAVCCLVRGAQGFVP